MEVFMLLFLANFFVAIGGFFGIATFVFSGRLSATEMSVAFKTSAALALIGMAAAVVHYVNMMP